MVIKPEPLNIRRKGTFSLPLLARATARPPVVHRPGRLRSRVSGGRRHQRSAGLRPAAISISPNVFA